jgi:hypothetical protein
MSELDPRGHPAPELLAAFVDGELAGNDLAEVTAHLRQCRDCRDIAGEVARFQEEEAKVVAPHRGGRAWWMAAAVAAVVAAIFVPLSTRLFDPLPRVQGGDRHITARLSGLDYAPYRSNRGGGGASPEARQFAAVVALQEAAEKKRTARNLDRFAQAELALGRTDAALGHLTEGLPLDPNNPTMLSNLSAAQYEAHKYADAVKSAERALALDPKLAAAAFNRALALEQLNRTASTAAWQQYLKLDSTSAWADEVRQKHLTQ